MDHESDVAERWDVDRKSEVTTKSVTAKVSIKSVFWKTESFILSHQCI